MKTIKVIESDKDTLKFAEHFATKTSVKNLLQGIQGAKAMSTIIENEQYGKEILGYSNLTEQFDDVLSDALKSYSAKVSEWKNAGETRGLKQRVLFFRDLVDERLEKEPSIGASLGDFTKSVTGKEIEKTLTDGEVTGDEALMRVLTLTAVRSFIIASMTGEMDVIVSEPTPEPEPERVDGEIVSNDEIEHASHHTTTSSGEERSTSNEIMTIMDEIEKDFHQDDRSKTFKMNAFINGVKAAFTKLSKNPDDVELGRMIDTMYPHLISNWEIIASAFNNEQVICPADSIHKKFIKATLPYSCKDELRGFNLDKLIDVVSSSSAKTDNNSIYGTLYTFHNIVHIMSNLDELDKVKELVSSFFNNLIHPDNLDLTSLIAESKEILKEVDNRPAWEIAMDGYGNVSAELWIKSIIKSVEKKAV